MFRISVVLGYESDETGHHGEAGAEDYGRDFCKPPQRVLSINVGRVKAEQGVYRIDQPAYARNEGE